MDSSSSPIGSKEFIVLMALLMSMVALTVDAMLPAMNQIGSDLGVQNPNDVQLIISSVFIGMAAGLMLYGPISDSFGRKNAIYLGTSIFLIGSLISVLSNDFYVMLVGRVIQGFGASSCRIVTIAMIRDKYVGNEMARIMSLILVVFILVPALAPAIGQGILWVAHWRGIFIFILALGLLGLVWLGVRQPETLSREKRLKFSFSVITSGALETLKHPVSRSYMFAAGLVFGAFVGYLTTAQQVLQGQYQVGEMFSVYFGALALAIGTSTFLNSKLVMRIPMDTLCAYALGILSVVSVLFTVYVMSLDSDPPLSILMAYFGIAFFCLGMPFGNFNALAVQPLGHIAGVASSVVGSVQTFISVLVGSVIGQLYDGSVDYLVLGFLFCSIGTFAIVMSIKNHQSPAKKSVH